MLKIAICDDELFFAEILKKYLEEYLVKRHKQYRIDIFESGEAFLEKNEETTSYEVVFFRCLYGKVKWN